MKHVILTLSLLAIFQNEPAFTEQSEVNSEWVAEHLDTIPDFPIPGIQFKSISPLLKNPEAFHKVIQTLSDRYRNSDVDAIAGLDSRGFIFGAALAYELNLPFIMVRKPGKLPGDVISKSYSLEYGKNAFEIERSSVKPGQKILVIDDLLATGGTASAACSLIEELGGVIYEFTSIIELKGLGGRERIGRPTHALLSISP